jgi:hypothetical protein
VNTNRFLRASTALCSCWASLFHRSFRPFDSSNLYLSTDWCPFPISTSQTTPSISALLRCPSTSSQKVIPSSDRLTIEPCL